MFITSEWLMIALFFAGSAIKKKLKKGEMKEPEKGENKIKEV